MKVKHAIGKFPRLVPIHKVISGPMFSTENRTLFFYYFELILLITIFVKLQSVFILIFVSKVNVRLRKKEKQHLIGIDFLECIDEPCIEMYSKHNTNLEFQSV